MVGPWVTATSEISGDALLSSPAAAETFARTHIERARAEMRQGKYGTGDAILEWTLEKLSHAARRQAFQSRFDLTLAVAWSLKGQSLEQSGKDDLAAESFASAVKLFAKLPAETLGPHDRSDFGVALAALGAAPEARRQIEAARADNGCTPEAARHLARLLLDAGETGEAETLLREALLVLPDDPDALAALGQIQAASGAAAAAGTLSQAAHMYLQRGRGRGALRTLDRLSGATADYPKLTGLRAEALRLDGQFEAAVAEYDRALAAEPGDSWLLAGRGSALAGLGRLDEARLELDRAIRLTPNSASLLQAGGEVAFRQGDFAGARDHALRAVAADPASPAACELTALAELASGALDAAVESARRALALDKSGNADLLRLNAQLERMAGLTETATELFSQLCRHPAALPDDHLTLAALLAESGRAGDAIGVAQAAAQHWERNPVLLTSLGRLFLDSGQPDEAARVLREAAELNPGSALTRLLFGQALARLGDTDEALREIGRAAERDRWSPEPHRARALLLADADAEHWSEAVTAAQELLALDPESVEALRILAADRLSAGSVAEAASLLNRARKVSPDDPETRLLLAETLADSNPRKALDILRQPPAALEERPRHLSQWLLLRARLQREREHWQQAETDYSRVIELRPELADAWAERGRARLGTGRLNQVLADAGQALRLDPRHLFARCTKAAGLIQLGLVEDARAELEAALRIEPDYLWALHLLARVTTDPDEARALIDRGLEADPDNRGLLTERAWLEIRLGDYQRALHMFNQLLEAAPENAEDSKGALVGQANALRLLGRVEDAVTTATEAAELGPDKETLKSLGLARLDADDVPGAIEALTRAHDADPDDATISVDLSYALAAADLLDGALEVLDRAVTANPADPLLLRQLAGLLNEIGEFRQAAHFAREGTQLSPADTGLWSALGWAQQYCDPPDLPMAEAAFRRVLDRGPADGPDPWVLSGIADVHYLHNDPRAEREYRQALEIADRQRPQRPDMVSVIGWCQFRLGDLRSAAQAFLERSSAEDSEGSDAFDLALVMLCDGRHGRAAGAYRDAIARVGARHALRRRGYLLVARTDLRQTRPHYPELRGLAIADEIEAALNSALAGLPPVPDLVARRRTGQPRG